MNEGCYIWVLVRLYRVRRNIGECNYLLVSKLRDLK